MSVFRHIIILCCLLLSLASCRSSRHAQGKSGLSDKQQLDFDYYYYSSEKEKLVGNLDQAIAFLSKCIQINPNSAPANYELASIYLSQGRLTEALAYSKKAAMLDEKNIWYQLLFAECLHKNKQMKESADVYEKIVKNHPNRIDIYYDWATALIYANKYQEAIKVYDQIEKKTGVTEEVSMQKEKLYIKLGSVDKAANEIQKLIEANPKETRYYGELANLYGANGQNQKAFEEIQKVLKMDPDNPYAHLAMADYYRNARNKEQSFKELKLAFESPELDIDTKVKILLSYFTITENAEELKGQAYELLDILIRIHPKEAKAYSIQGDFLSRDKKLKEAAEAYSKALDYDKEHFPIWNQLLLLYSEQNDYENMYLKSKEAIELFPTQPILFLFNGVAAMQKKLHKEAVEAFNQGASLTVDNDAMLGQFYMYLGDSYHALEEHKNSDENYEKALKIDPDNVYVLNNYAYYLSLRSDNLDRAEELSKKSNELMPNTSNYEDTYAWILFQQKKYEDAKIWLEKAINHGGAGNGVILEHLGDTYSKLNIPDKAVEYWEKAKGKGGVSDKLDKKIKERKFEP